VRRQEHYTRLNLPLFYPNHYVKLLQQDVAALMRTLMAKSRSALVLEVEVDGLSAMFNWFGSSNIWISWYDMLVVLLSLRDAIEKYCQRYEDELEEDALSWKKLRTIKDFLSPFSRATLYTEGDSTSTFRINRTVRSLQWTS
jgi:hypothetical protein